MAVCSGPPLSDEQHSEWETHFTLSTKSHEQIQQMLIANGEEVEFDVIFPLCLISALYIFRHGVNHHETTWTVCWPPPPPPLFNLQTGGFYTLCVCMWVVDRQV